MTDSQQSGATDDRLKEAMSVPCGGGEPCWWNPETGYTEYCPVHESIIADFVYGSPERTAHV